MDSRYAVVRFCQSQRILFLGHPGLSEINHNGDKHCELSLYKLDVSYASQKWSKVTVTLTRILTDRISSNWTSLWLDWWSPLDLFSFVHLCKLLLLACNFNVIFDLVFLNVGLLDFTSFCDVCSVKKNVNADKINKKWLIEWLVVFTLSC